MIYLILVAQALVEDETPGFLRTSRNPGNGRFGRVAHPAVRPRCVGIPVVRGSLSSCFKLLVRGRLQTRMGSPPGEGGTLAAAGRGQRYILTGSADGFYLVGNPC